MNSFSSMSVGARIRRLRGAVLSQRDLAEAAGVSVDTVRKLEQEARHTVSVTVLQKIAWRLDVDLATLAGKLVRFPSTDPNTGVLAIRDALTPVDDLLGEAVLDGQPVDLEQAQQQVDHAGQLYWTGQHAQLAALLPRLLPQLRATAHTAPAAGRARAHELLARCYGVTGAAMVRFGHPAAAWLALREALWACDHGADPDPLLVAALRGSAAWQLLHQGRYADSVRVAVRAAKAIEPAGDVPLPHRSVYGALLATAASAAGRDQRADQARELLAESQAVADRIGSDRTDYHIPFGPAQVLAQTVDLHVVTGHYGEALAAATAMPRDAGLPLVARARHLADLAYAHARLRHVQHGRDTLLALEAMAPEWLRHHTLCHQVAAELVRLDRDPVLRGLAHRLGVDR